jgi:hypothetical protein
MIIEFYEWFIYSGQNLHMRNFRVGYIWGMLVVLVLLIIVKTFHYWLFCKRRKINEVKIPGEGGSLFVSSGAIGDMVKFVGATFDYIDIAKVSLWEGKYGIVMDINVSYDMHGTRFPELAKELKTAIRSNLEGQLGIDSIKFIDIHDKKITDTKNSRF